MRLNNCPGLLGAGLIFCERGQVRVIRFGSVPPLSLGGKSYVGAGLLEMVSPPLLTATTLAAAGTLNAAGSLSCTRYTQQARL